MLTSSVSVNVALGATGLARVPLALPVGLVAMIHLVVYQSSTIPTAIMGLSHDLSLDLADYPSFDVIAASTNLYAMGRLSGAGFVLSQIALSDPIEVAGDQLFIMRTSAAAVVRCDVYYTTRKLSRQDWALLKRRTSFGIGA